MIDCRALRFLISPLLTFLFLFLLLFESYIVVRIIEALPRTRVSPDWFHRKDSNNPNYQSTVRYARSLARVARFLEHWCLSSFSLRVDIVTVGGYFNTHGSMWTIKPYTVSFSRIPVSFFLEIFEFSFILDVTWLFFIVLTVKFESVKYTLEIVLLPGCTFLSGGIVRETVRSWVT